MGGGSLYELENNLVLSVNEKLEPVQAGSLFYFQDYDGPIIEVSGGSGRNISVTPEHPLLVNRLGRITWLKAKDLRPGLDSFAFLSQVPVPPPKIFPNPIENLRSIYTVVTFEDYLRISSVTADFSDLSALSSTDLNIVRIISHLSKNRLSRIARIDYNSVRSF